MKLYDRKTGTTVANIITGHGMTLDEALSLMGYTVDDDGQITTEDGNLLDAWYDDLEMDYSK